MVNHIRNLFYNRAGVAQPDISSLGEEYVPAEFTPKQIPAALVRPWQVLFGRRPDTLFLNYRLRQIMTILHTSPMEEFIFRKDPRITYWPIRDHTLFDSVFGVQITAHDGSDTIPTVYGDGEADEKDGRCQFSWLVAHNGMGRVTITPNVGNIEPVTVDVEFTAGLSSAIPLPGSGLTMRIPVSGDRRWSVEAACRPTTALGDVLACFVDAMQSSGLGWAFQEPLTEPYTTFYDVWTDDPDDLARYAALLMAVAWRLDEQPPTGYLR